MTEDKRQIWFLFESFVQGMKQGHFAGKDIFAEDADILCSHTGSGRGAKDAERLLAYPGPRPKHIKQNVENVIFRRKGTGARQSFHLHQLYVLHGENGEFHYFQYGGTFVLGYRKEKEGWRIESVRFDLGWTDGNTFWVKGWKLIDFHMPKRYKQVISWKTDGVCRAIPRNEEEQTEEEEIREKLFLYGWMIDTEDYGLFGKIAVEDVRVEDGYHGIVIEGNKNWTDFLYTLNQKEPCLHHTYRITSVEIREREALGRMSRLEPNRIGTKTINEDTWFLDWLTLDYEIRLRKSGEGWRMEEIRFWKNLRNN